MDNLIHLITPDNFTKEVTAEKKPFLLLCMPKDDDFPSQLSIVEIMAEHHESRLKVGIMADAFVEYFKKKLGVVGTPTFLIFFDGKELNRMWGLADSEGLEQFVLEVMEQLEKEPLSKLT